MEYLRIFCIVLVWLLYYAFCVLFSAQTVKLYDLVKEKNDSIIFHRIFFVLLVLLYFMITSLFGFILYFYK